MLKNYVKIVFRNLRHNKTFSLISISGLALGIAVCLVLYMYVSYEKNYDTFNENADNIYRVKNIRYYASGTDSSAGCIALLGPTLKEEIPEIVDFARLRKISSLVAVDNQYFNEKNIFWADSSFLTMFSFPLISGDAGKALAGRYCAVLTKSSAQKYFRNKNAVGETIKIGDTDFKITGITEDVPANSHIKFDILLSFNTQLTDRFCWGCNNNNTYIQVMPGTKMSTVEAKLPLVLGKLHNRQKDGFDRAYFLQPLKNIHLYSHLRSEHEENGNAKTIYFLSLTAILIFLIESFIINLIAVLISLFIVELTLPYWSKLIGMPGSFSLWNNTSLFMLLAVMVIVSPIIAGFYPAFVLSSYSPVSILKGSFKNSEKGIFLRKGLVVFQFTASIILIVVIIVSQQQLSFMRNKDLGFNIRQKLVVNTPAYNQKGGDLTSSYNTFINELQNQSLIEDATFSSIIPGMENGDVSGGVRYGEQSIKQGKQAYFTYVAQNYLNFFDINLICGRNFFDSEITDLYQKDTNKALIINESAVKAFGFASPEKAIGAAINRDNNKIGSVIGVIKDYHQQSLEKEIKPTVFESTIRGNYFIFEISTENIPKKIEGIKSNFTKYFQGNTFEYKFLDELFDMQYKTDVKTHEIFSVFTFVSIFISCLGLIGLSSIMITNRTKEIGIRKTLGATVLEIVYILSKEFTKWVILANIIAWPVAYYLMNNWLKDFAYRINITPWIFLISGAIALIIALLTVSVNAIKAATANPVKSLKYE